MPQYKRKPTKRDNDIFRAMFDEDIPGYVPETTAVDSLREEKAGTERRLSKGEEPRTIGERTLGEKLGILEKPKSISELMGERRQFVEDSLGIEVLLGGPEAITPEQLKGLERVKAITPERTETVATIKIRELKKILPTLNPDQLIEWTTGITSGEISPEKRLTALQNLFKIYETKGDVTNPATAFAMKDLAENRPDMTPEEIKALFVGDETIITKEKAEEFLKEINKLIGLGIKSEKPERTPVPGQEQFFFDKK